MVRLLLKEVVNLMRQQGVFQSHNGAIAALSIVSPFYLPPYFQSHNGAIAARPAIVNGLTSIDFQSHNGAIAAV